MRSARLQSRRSRVSLTECIQAERPDFTVEIDVEPITTGRPPPGPQRRFSRIMSLRYNLISSFQSAASPIT